MALASMTEFLLRKVRLMGHFQGNQNVQKILLRLTLELRFRIGSKARNCQMEFAK
jgi:hypothetical protein